MEKVLFFVGEDVVIITIGAEGKHRRREGEVLAIYILAN